MAFKSLFTYETEEQEAARLAQSPEGSTNRFLSGLPVTIAHISRGMVIEMPRATSDRVVVVVDQRRPSGHTYEPGELNRHDHAWTLVIIASTDARYPVGGYDIVAGEAELRRGRLVSEQAILDTKEVR